MSADMVPGIIYHYPQPFAPENSGSQVHVLQMLNAFRQVGYDVECVKGWADERKQAIERIRAEVAHGRQFDFVYACAATAPTLLEWPNRAHPLLDPRFFRWARDRRIPVGLFYGDVHWRFDHYRQNVPLRVHIKAIPLYWYDWLGYLSGVDHLFVPSLRMAPFLPTHWQASRMSALWPGCVPADTMLPSHSTPPGSPLKLFYVGGITPPLYDLKPMIDAIRGARDIQFTLCCRKFEWDRFRSYYEPIDGKQIIVVHASRAELGQYYANADLFALLWRHPYLDFAMPVKLIEALGYGLPIIATAGTEPGRFVTREDAGWVVNTAEEFSALLQQLSTNRVLIEEKRLHLLAIRNGHTWQRRAEMVAETLRVYRRDLNAG